MLTKRGRLDNLIFSDSVEIRNCTFGIFYAITKHKFVVTLACQWDEIKFSSIDQKTNTHKT